MGDQSLARDLEALLLANDAALPSPSLFRALLELLAKGEPVRFEDLATATNQRVEAVRSALGVLCDLEIDDRGRIVGAGISLRPTPHRFEIDGRRLYTWCALDTLIFPVLLDRAARVESPCQRTGIPIRVDVDPSGVTSVQPEAAVVSIVTPERGHPIRGAFCNQVHFFSSPDAAKPWIAEHVGGHVLGVADAFQLGRALALGMKNGASCC